jgi:histidinol-phosphate phosphatase family protein
MRVLVNDRSFGADAQRMRAAAGGLALRGHEVWWHGEHPPFGESGPPSFHRIARLRGVRADVVLGGAPIATAVSGWRVHADAMVLSPDSLGRWTVIDHWSRESLESAVVLERGDPALAESGVTGLEFERLLAWSDDPVAAESDPMHADTEILERACERLLARRSGRLLRPAVFLDRDGTLIVEHGYLSDPAGVELLPGVPHALRILRAAGFTLVVVSNQAGVGRGYYPLAAVHATMAGLRRALREHGVEIDAIYFCPHHPDAGCACRKPGTALFVEAARNSSLDLKQSFVIGDKVLDVAAAERAGGRGVLVRTGYGRSTSSVTDVDMISVTGH